MWKYAVCACLVSSATVCHSQGLNEPGKYSGVAFFDYFDVSKHHDPAIQGKGGFWFRRIYLTYDKKLDPKVDVRIRFEARSVGDFSTSSNMDPFVKDAYVRYTENRQRFTAGMMPTPTFENTESMLAYRSIERTPIDLYRLGNSRDKGLSVSGPIDRSGKFGYSVMVGNGSGTKSTIGDTKTFYGALTYRPNESLILEAYGDTWDRLGDNDWTSWKGEAIYVTPRGNAGVMYVQQHRDVAGAAGMNMRVASFYGDIRLGEKWRPFVRLDSVMDPLPEADKIDYLILSKVARFTTFMAGARYSVTKDVEVAPVLMMVRYGQPSNGPRPGDDVFLRLTFNVRF